MRIPDSQALIMIFIMAAITFFIRVLPFLLFPGNKKRLLTYSILEKYFLMRLSVCWWSTA